MRRCSCPPFSELISNFPPPLPLVVSRELTVLFRSRTDSQPRLGCCISVLTLTTLGFLVFHLTFSFTRILQLYLPKGRISFNTANMSSTEEQPVLKHTPNLVLSEATPGDIPQISTVFFRCFDNTALVQMFPPVPSVQNWWDDANMHDLLYRDSDRYVVVKDMAADGKIVAYAKWQIATGDNDSNEEFFPRFPPWPAESDNQLCTTFFDHISKDRVQYFSKRGLRQHYCKLSTYSYLPVI